MSEFRIPAANWSDELAKALRAAEPGDTVIVRTEPMLRLAVIAAQRMGRQGVILEVAGELDG